MARAPRVRTNGWRAQRFGARRRAASTNLRLMLPGLALALLLFQPLLGWRVQTQATAAQRPARTSANGAVRVIDGDTFDYGGQRIRIADIDAPELNARCAEEAWLAAAATRRLRALLAQGPFQLVPVSRDEDRHGRKLRIVVRNGRSIGDILAAEGLARTWSGRHQPWCG